MAKRAKHMNAFSAILYSNENAWMRQDANVPCSHFFFFQQVSVFFGRRNGGKGEREKYVGNKVFDSTVPLFV